MQSSCWSTRVRITKTLLTILLNGFLILKDSYMYLLTQSLNVQSVYTS